MIGCVLLSLFSPLRAQEYFVLTASQVRIDSLLPVFSYQKQLGAHYADSLWQVSIEYPLFEDLSAAEVRRYKQISGALLPEMPEVKQVIATARKKGVLEVSFVPLVYRDGKYKRLVEFKLNVEAKASRAQGVRNDVTSLTSQAFLTPCALKTMPA